MKTDRIAEIFPSNKNHEPQVSGCKETLDWQVERIKELTEFFLKSTEHVSESQYKHMSDIHWSDIRRIVGLTFKPIQYERR